MLMTIVCMCRLSDVLDHLIKLKMQTLPTPCQDNQRARNNSFEEHLLNLAAVFDQLQEANLKLKPQKCTFGKKQINFLGHIIVSPADIPADPDKTANWPESQTQQEVQ